jgi:hypothetical protein
LKNLLVAMKLTLSRQILAVVTGLATTMMGMQSIQAAPLSTATLVAASPAAPVSKPIPVRKKKTVDAMKSGDAMKKAGAMKPGVMKPAAVKPGDAMKK